MELKELILKTNRELKETRPEHLRAVLGFDGAVDEILEVVDVRTGYDFYSPVRTISEFSQRVSGAAGLSTNLELIAKQLKTGGCGPNMATALISLGVCTTYIGAIGKSNPTDLFRDFYLQCCRAYPIAMPTFSHALEFTDGKIIMAKLENAKAITWESILEQLSLEHLASLVREADIISFVNWTETPYMHTIWDQLISRVMPYISKHRRPIIFFDLADPAKREQEDIVVCIDIIRQFSRFGRVVLGLNRKEATEVGMALKLQTGGSLHDAPLRAITTELAKKLDLYGLVVHPTEAAAAVVDGDYYEIPGPYTACPRLTTGAGDNFNGGTVLGLALGLEPSQALVMGAATSGFYVRTARSPDCEDLSRFLARWAENIGEEFY